MEFESWGGGPDLTFAILSHAWDRDEEIFQDRRESHIRCNTAAWRHVRMISELARAQGIG